MSSTLLWAVQPRQLFLYLQVYCTAQFLGDRMLGFTWASGMSMLPTLLDSGNLLLLDRWNLPQRVRKDDIVVARSPIDKRMFVCKRVVGLPGERVYVRIHGGCSVPTVVPAGHLWLEGDNPPFSRDSREYGPVPMALLNGRVLCRLLPVGLFGSLPPRPE